VTGVLEGKAPTGLWGTAANFTMGVLAAAGSLFAVVPVLQRPLSLLILAASPVGLALIWKRLSATVRWTSASLAGVGLMASVVAGVDLRTAAAGLALMSSIFAFVVVVRLLELPVSRRGYDLAAASKLEGFASTPQGNLIAGAAVTYVFGASLSFGGVPLAYRAVRALDSNDDPAGTGGLVSRSFTASNTWAPVSPPVAFALAASGASWRTYLPLGVLLSAAGLLLVPIGPRPVASATRRAVPVSWLRVFEFLALFVVLLIAIVFISESFPAMNNVGATIAAIVVVVAGWETLTGGARTLGARTRVHLRDDRRHWPDQFALFTSGGLLVATAQWWTAHEGGIEQLGAIGGLPVETLLLLTPFAMALLAIVGFYPIVVLVVFATVLAPLGGAQWDAHVTMAVVVGATGGFLLSPFTGLTLMIGALSDRSSFEVGLRWNRWYAIWMLILGSALVVGAWTISK
jgi:C4-dicarboxylate transporter, DcuC family